MDAAGPGGRAEGRRVPHPPSLNGNNGYDDFATPGRTDDGRMPGAVRPYRRSPVPPSDRRDGAPSCYRSRVSPGG
ncbi:hypothetical protein GCM10025734_50930 [Kitasatospora paranensis]